MMGVRKVLLSLPFCSKKNRRLTTKILTILKTNYNKNELIKLKQLIEKLNLNEIYYESKKT